MIPRLALCNRLFPVLLAATAAFLPLTDAIAMPPHPDLIEQLKQSGQLERLVERLAAARAKGVWSSNITHPDPKSPSGKALYVEPNTADTFRAIVILVDFSDNQASSGVVFARPSDFSTRLFSSDGNDNTYSMAEFYYENSYGSFVMMGDVVGWYRMPQTYAYYVQGNNGWGDYPHNAQRLAEDAILAADPDVDYSLYDNNDDGWIDGVFIVHAGPGAEQTGSDNQIWSHQWSLSQTFVLDGVNIRDYSMEPEEYSGVGVMTMGVFAHEYGHVLGLPDLYDTDYSSNGIGNWSLMSGGSWNGNGSRPAFMDAWCKGQLGFLSFANITANEQDVEVASSYHNPVAFRLWENGQQGPQYFLIENRRKTGHDGGIPASGLMIMHIDETIGGNWDETHPLVAIEQADGLMQLENGVNSGDGGDVWSTLTKDAFDDLSNPNTRMYGGQPTRTAVWNISAPDSLMYASFDISYSRPRFQLLSAVFSDSALGNNNGIPEAGESLTLSFEVLNRWITATNVTAHLSCDNNDIILTIPNVNIGTVAGGGSIGNNNGAPLIFQIPVDFTPCIDSFFLQITSDNPLDTADFGFELRLGIPSILIVDDDAGDAWEQSLVGALLSVRRPYAVHDKQLQGSPTGAELGQYEMVLWLTGDARPDILSSADVAAMQQYLDGGGRLFLTGQSLVRELNGENQAFLNGYLKTQYDGDLFFPAMDGVTGSPVGDGIRIRYENGTNQTDPQVLTPLGTAQAAFHLANGQFTGLTYSGSYKLVLFAFGFEGISDQFVANGYASKEAVLSRILAFFDSSEGVLNPKVVSMTIGGEASLEHVVNHHPEMIWSVSDTTGNGIEQYEIEVGTGALCSNRDNMWAPAVFMGSDTAALYDGLALEDGVDYVWQLRVYNGINWSDWSQLPFHMNVPSDPGLLAEPINDTLVSTSTPTLKRSNPIDPEGDPLTFDFEVFTDAGLTNLVVSASGIAPQSPITGWTVDVPLAEDQHFFWRSRTFDGFEFSAYTKPASFWVNAVNQAPQPFSLLLPSDEDTVSGELPLLTWQVSFDADPADQIEYILWVSTDVSFATHTEVTGIVGAAALFPFPVEPNLRYYWKVKARDIAGAETWSSESFSFVTGTGGCCQLRGDIDGDGSGPDISDLMYLVNYMFGGGQPPGCLAEADINGSGGNPDIIDLVRLVTYMFQSGPSPAPC